MTFLQPVLRPVLQPALRGLFDSRLSPRFSPTSLFASGEQGAFYDPFDLLTLTQDASGTTFVSTTGQPVGLMLDKRLGLVRGPELRATGAVSTLGTPPSVATYDGSTGAGTVYRTDLMNQSGVLFSGLVSNGFYEVLITVTSGSIFIRNGGIDQAASPALTAGTYRVVARAAVGASISVTASAPTSASFTGLSVRELPGNHAIQTTTTARPMLAAGGALYRIDYDGVDDLMTTTFPNLGTNVTIVRSVPGVGASILTAQTIGAGNWNDSTDHCGLVVINRALTAQETTYMTAWANERAGV